MAGVLVGLSRPGISLLQGFEVGFAETSDVSAMMPADEVRQREQLGHVIGVGPAKFSVEVRVGDWVVFPERIACRVAVEDGLARQPVEQAERLDLLRGRSVVLDVDDVDERLHRFEAACELVRVAMVAA